MKVIPARELKPGDVYANEIKLHGRQAFFVNETPIGKNYIVVTPRGEKESKKAQIKEGQKVYLLRHVD